MRSGASTRHQREEHTVTDRILNFCASGRFGVREAIAAVTASKNKQKHQACRPQDREKKEE